MNTSVEVIYVAARKVIIRGYNYTVYRRPIRELTSLRSHCSSTSFYSSYSLLQPSCFPDDLKHLITYTTYTFLPLSKIAEMILHNPL